MPTPEYFVPVEVLAEIETLANEHGVSLLEMLYLRQPFKTIDRLRVAIPLLAERRRVVEPGDGPDFRHERLVHRQLAELVATSREKVTKSLNQLRVAGVLVDEMDAVVKFNPHAYNRRNRP